MYHILHEQPFDRAWASMAYDSANGGQLVLFGGVYNGTYDNDTWTWNGSTWAQLTPSTSPPARDGASMAYDPANGGQLVLFGGANATTALSDTWAWNDNTNTWAQLTPATSPPLRSLGAMAYDPANGGQLVLFGGGYGATDYNDTWTWNGATWAQLLPAASPSPATRSPWRTTWPPIRWSCSAV